MTIGVLLIAISFIASIVATTAYFLYYRDRQPALLRLANQSFTVMSVGVLLSLAMLITLILNHHFAVNYVYSYSSRALNKFYLFSTLWAGQQGTFLLWLFYSSIYGFILMRKTARKNPLVLGFLVLSQAFLLLILLKKSPFSMVWHQYAEVPVGFTPQDGAGLNPLLQNPWMVIHPPTLFVGYSSTVVAFVFALSALIRRDAHGWVKEARPWVIFNVMILGVGIIMGGYWAYVTLGWGGYWGWDPVENASLVPWIFSLVLLHGIIIQTKRKALVRSNFLWAGLSFLTMLWGSYLTRSGVLTDFSVHSFAPSGLSVYLLLIQGVFTFGFFYLWIRFMMDYHRSGENPVEFGKGIFNRETLMFFGMAVLLFLGFFVLLGTSAPLYTQWFGTPASLSPDFYNTMLIPAAVFIFLLIAIAPLLAWKTAELRNKRFLLGSMTAALMVTMLAATLGLEPMTPGGSHTPYYAIEGTVTPAFFEHLSESMLDGFLKYSPYLLFFLGVLVIFTNARLAYIFVKNNFPKAGGYIAHVGMGFMLIGALTSSVYDTSEKVMIPRGEFARTQLGHEVQFVSFVDMPDGKDRVKLRVRTAYGAEYDAYPKFYYSDYTKGYMVSPDVRVQFARDLYISPISFTPAQLLNQREVTLGKGETQKLENLEITFQKFDVKMEGMSQEVVAHLDVKLEENGETATYHIAPVLKASGGKMESREQSLGDSGYRAKISRVNATTGQVTLAVITPAATSDTPAKDMLAIELSEKPLISILWFGTIVFACGAFLALVSHVRSRKPRKKVERVAAQV